MKSSFRTRKECCFLLVSASFLCRRASSLLRRCSSILLSPTLSVLVDSLPLALPVLPLPVVVDVASLSSNFGEKSRYEVEQLIFI